MILLLCLSLLTAIPDNTFLPQWLTPEESLRINEIGRGFIPTNPPEGWVETPGEFEPLRCVFVTWRYGTYDAIEREIVREVAEVSKAFIIVRNTSEQSNITNYLTSGGVPLDSVVFVTFNNNSVWTRDYGPWFIRKQDNGQGIVDFIYNRPRPQDDSIPYRIGSYWLIPVYGSQLTHAGGNFMTDGLGTGFASTLIYEENPQFTHHQIDSLMLAYSGLDQFIVVPRINIEYTGHIDLWTKILNDTLIMVGEYAPGHSNYTLLNQAADSLARCKNREGRNYRVVRIPMPYSTSSAPPTYLNSLFVNNKVLVPTWSLPEDDSAIHVYQRALPGHEIVAINCSAMSGSGGAIHCITMQIPSSRYIHIKHRPLANTNDTINSYRVRAQIITSSSISTDSITYLVNSDSELTTSPLNPVPDTPGVYVGYIEPQSIGDTIHYYIRVTNSQGLTRTSPNDIPDASYFYSFIVTPYSGVSEVSNINPISTLKVFPNPADNNISFSLRLSKATKLKIELYNPLGQRVKTLLDGITNSGLYSVRWNFLDDQNHKLSQGTYFYRIITDQETSLGKILYLK
jgi:agmatine/peptidylarginine deiminase